jgi:hypothetical protein
MPTAPPLSSWTTNTRFGYACRSLGELTVIEHRSHFFLLSDKISRLEATSLLVAVEEADALVLPGEWRQVVGMWVSPGWKVQKEEDGWGVFAEEGVRKSKQVFKRPDLARKWCEIRYDRVGINLRGPKPRQEGPDGREAEEAV